MKPIAASTVLAACLLAAAAQAQVPPAAGRRPFELDLPLPAPAPTAPTPSAAVRPSSPSTDFLLSHAPRVSIECQAQDGITYATLQPGRSQCTARIEPTLIALHDTFAYYVTRADYQKVRGAFAPRRTPGHAYAKGVAVFRGQTAEASFAVDRPARAATGAIGLELLGAAAANVGFGLSALALRAGMPVPLEPPDWKAIGGAAVKIAANLSERGAEHLELTGVSVWVWLCNERLCSPPAAMALAVSPP